MKRLLLFLLCQGSMDGFSQVQKNGICWQHNIAFIGKKCPECNEAARLDTLPSSILISHKPPSFGHAIHGYCIYQGDHCIGKHLRYWHRRWIVIGPEYTVWGCK